MKGEMYCKIACPVKLCGSVDMRLMTRLYVCSRVKMREVGGCGGFLKVKGVYRITKGNKIKDV